MWDAQVLLCCCFYLCCSRVWLPLLPGVALLLTLFTIVYDKRQGGLLNATAKVVAGARLLCRLLC